MPSADELPAMQVCCARAHSASHAGSPVPAPQCSQHRLCSTCSASNAGYTVAAMGVCSGSDMGSATLATNGLQCQQHRAHGTSDVGSEVAAMQGLWWLWCGV